MRTDDIVRQRFAKVFRGYDVQEVDLFLDDVIREVDRLEQERNALLVRLEALLQELDRCDKLLHEYQQKEKAELLEPAQVVVPQETPQPDAVAKEPCLTAANPELTATETEVAECDLGAAEANLVAAKLDADEQPPQTAEPEEPEKIEAEDAGQPPAPELQTAPPDEAQSGAQTAAEPPPDETQGGAADNAGENEKGETDEP